MKSFLLTVATWVSFTCIASAQGLMYPQNIPQDYLWEVGFNYGFSQATRPLGPADPYIGTRTEAHSDYSLHLAYYPTCHWMLNLDLGNRKWESFGNWQLNDNFGQKLQTREITFLVAQAALNENVGISYVIPFYSDYNTFNRANIYFGVTGGLMQTINDGSTHYSSYNAHPDSSLRYLSRYDYEAGMGYNFGVQVGGTYYIIPRLGVNVDLSARYASIETTDVGYRAENSHYHLMYFPVTFGVRWRF